ncbi:MAG: metallophosphoesterase, partial [Absicoccus porci]
MDRSVKVKKLEATSGRTIAISDIHGNYDRYLALLKKIHYRPNQDRLILVGDFIEKGPKNLLLLRYIMHQAETEDVHVLMG